MASYASKVGQDIARWVENGLIDAETAEKLRRDVEANVRRSFSFGTVLAMLAAILLGAAILIFIAANWETIPRITRVLAVFAVIAAGYVGGAWLKLRDHPAFAEAAWVVAAAAFGGAIALIGQMYHFSGDESGAILTWCAGTALAAIALRSNPLTIMAVAIADGWLVIMLLNGFDFRSGFDIPYLYVLMAFALFLISYWTRSQPSRHLIILSLILYAGFVAAADEWDAMAIQLAIGSAVIFAAAVYASEPLDGLLQLGGRLPLHAFLGFLVGMAILQFQYDEGGGLILTAALMLAGIVAALVLAGRDSRGLRWLAYIGFAYELVWIYLVMMGTMLDTASFFLAAAVILGLLAFVIIRVEKRMRAGVAEGGSAS